jgi:serine-type D-Ala-D-Ala carboxypeptidase/endopeptidase
MRFRHLSTLALLALAATSLRADDPEPPKPLADRVAELTADYRSTRPFAALAVGVIQNGKKESFGFGELEHDDKKSPVDGRTLFEIGSCTKVFTSLSLAVLVSRGDVKLDDPIKTLLPDAELSEDAAKITLKELSTHTSGLPRIAAGMYFDAILNSDNPYKNYTPDRLLDVLKSWKAPPKKTSAYSNLGAGLLGYVLQQKEHAENYESLIRSTVTTPLGLGDTVVTLSEDQQTRYATAHDTKGKSLKSWDFVALAGAGALRSTADDMLTFLDHQMHPESSPLNDAIELSQQIQYEAKRGTMGLGWQISPKGEHVAIWHNGATGGYRSFCAFERKSGIAVVLLSNTGDAFAGDDRIDRMGFDLLKSLVEAKENKKD